jgi:hypothetical protein
MPSNVPHEYPCSNPASERIVEKSSSRLADFPNKTLEEWCLPNRKLSHFENRQALSRISIFSHRESMVVNPIVRLR